MKIKRFNKTGLTAILAVAVLALAVLSAGCIGTDTPSEPAGTISIAGSTTVLPAAQAEAEVYMDNHANADIQISGGSGVGVTAVSSGTADIGMLSRDLKFSGKEEYCKDAEGEFLVLGEKCFCVWTEHVVGYVFENVGDIFSAKNGADYFKSQHRKVDLNTIYHYLNALESAFIIRRIPRYNLRGREVLATMEKYYVGDVSLIYALMGYKDRMIAGILENLVMQELSRRGYRVFVGKQDGREVDFVAEQQEERVYVQVCFRMESEETARREFASLLELRDHYPKFVVSMDEVRRENVEGVRHVPIADFLLMDGY